VLGGIKNAVKLIYYYSIVTSLETFADPTQAERGKWGRGIIFNSMCMETHV